jgi:hypothetical protein
LWLWKHHPLTSLAGYFLTSLLSDSTTNRVPTVFHQIAHQNDDRRTNENSFQLQSNPPVHRSDDQSISIVLESHDIQLIMLFIIVFIAVKKTERRMVIERNEMETEDAIKVASLMKMFVISASNLSS